MSEADAQRYNSKAGVYVTSVTEGSCAGKADIRQGDVILELGGKAVASTGELAEAKKDYKAGDSCEVKLWRSGKELTVTVTFDEEPSQLEAQAPAAGQEEPRQDPGRSDGDGSEWGSWWDMFGDFFDYYEDREDESGDDRGSFWHFGS